jgi:hypothetical protein
LCEGDRIYFTPTGREVTYKNGEVFLAERKLFSVTDGVFALPNLSFTFVHQKGENLQFLVSYTGIQL